MPIEIKELHIKAVVASEKTTVQRASLTSEEVLKLKKEISKEVMEKVLKTLQQKSER